MYKNVTTHAHLLVLILLWPFFSVSNSFVENKGQIADQFGKLRTDVKYVARYGDLSIAFRENGLTYYFTKEEALEESELPAHLRALRERGEDYYDKKMSYLKIEMNFNTANLTPHIQAIGEQSAISNYYLAHCADGIKDVHQYDRIKYVNIYDNIDLIFYHNEGKLKYDFVLKPGADVSDISWSYEGNTGLRIDDDGALHVENIATPIIESKPVTFYSETGVSVKSEYKINGDEVSFDLAAYNEIEELVIDPELNWSTFFNGNGAGSETWANPVYDTCGNMFALAYASSTNLPTLDIGGNWFEATYTTSSNDNKDLYIVKFTPEGELVWATYFGSDATDVIRYTYGKSLAIDGFGNLYTTAYIQGANPTFVPLTDYLPGTSYYETQIRSARTYINAFDDAGNLIWGTMFNQTTVNNQGAGTTVDGIVADEAGNLYFTGSTYNFSNVGYPLVDPGGGAHFDNVTTGNQQGIVGKFDVNHQLVWSTYVNYFTGANNEWIQGGDITVDQNGNLFVSGRTRNWTGAPPNPSFLIVNPGGGAYIENQHQGEEDGFIMKFNNNYSLVWSTIYGGSDRDRPVGIETDIDNNVYIIGRRTKSPDLPVFDPGGGAHFSGVLSGVNNDGESYLLSFDNNGVRRWATYLGIGPGGSDFSGLTIDEGKNIYVSGMLYGGGLPIVNKPGSYNDATYNGGVRDMGIMEFDPNFNLTWSSYMGGNDNDHFEFRMASDILPCGDTVIAILGRHNSPNFPTVDPGNNAYYDPSMVGFGNSGIVRFIKPDTMEREPIDTVVCNATSVLLDAYEPNATYVWQDGSTDSVYLATTSDTFWVDITLRCCTYRDTFIVEFLEPPKDIDTLTCAGQNVLLDATVLNATYSWQDGSTNATYNAGAPGIYWVDVDVGNCIKRDTFEVVFYEDSTYQISSCAGSNSTLIPTYTNATSYLWQDGSTGSTFNAINNGTYYVDMVINGCNLTDTFHVTQFIASAKIDTTVCPGSSVFLNVYTVGATYSWHDGSIQPFYNANNSGFYWVDITLGSCTVRDSFEVTISQVLIPQYFDSLVCPDSSVLFDATSAGAVGYLWNDGSTLASFQADTAGIYTVEIDFGNCIRKDTFELKYVALSSGNNFNMQLCPGQLVFLYANPNNATYSWQDGTSNQFNTVTQQGVYWVDISLNGCTKRDSFDVAFTVVPSGIFVDTSVCQGQAVTFDATDPSATSYTWDNGTTLPTFNTSIPGIYWVDKTINGCDVRDTFSLSLYSDQVIDSILCPGNTMTLSATTSPATAYLWSDGTSNSSIQINSPGTYWVDVTISGCTYRDTFNVITIPAEMKTDSSICTAGNIILDAYLPGATYVWQNGSTNPTLSVNSTGIYWVDISLQGCSKRDSFDIIYTQAPQGVYIDTLVCQGQNVNLDATDINATGYSWNDGSSNPNLNVAVGGIYWVDKSMNTGCIIRDTFELSYQSNQIFDTVICTGQQITLQASSQTASSYTWHDGTTASTFIAVSPGIYWVDISESGCTWRDTFNVNGIGLGQVIDTTICLGNTVILDAYIPGAIYLWSSGSTNPSLLVNANGTYFVDVSINGCTKTDTFHVTTITTYQGTTTDTLICVGGSLNMFASNTSGSNYLWQNGNTGISDVANGPGVYWVNYMINGCITADTFIVSNHPLNQGDIYDVELCPNQILLLYGSPSNALYTWNDGNTDQFFTVSDSGVYWVDVEVDKCTKRDSFIVTHANVPEPFAIDTFICYQDSIQISAFDNNALSYLWYDSTTLATGVIDSVGTFWVEIDYGICVNRNFYNVFYQSQPLKLASDTIVICKGESYVLIPNIQGSNYEWQDGSTNSSYEVTEEGVYWVNVFDGCAFSADTVQFLSDNCNCQMHMPTGFSPDADGLNDIFKPEFSCDVEPPYTFRVFNRWGDLLFETDNPDEGWDGNYIGTPVQMGVYIWRLEYSMDIKGIREDFEEYGKITILRNGKGE